MNAPLFDDLRVPPYSLEAEQAVLGGLLISGRAHDANAWAVVSGLLIEEDFYRQDHRLIFRAIATLASQNQPLDILVIQNALASHNDLENAGGFAYLVTLVRETPSAANIKAYAEIVHEKAMLRAVLQTCAELSDAVYSKAADSKTLVERAVQSFFTLETKGTRGLQSFTPLKAILRKLLPILEERSASDNPIIGEQSGLVALDNALSGFEDNKLYILAARPRVGKTTLAMTIAENFALNGKPVAFFSQEMSELNLGEKILASQGRVDFAAVRSAHLTEEQWVKVATAVKKMSNVPFYVDESTNISPADVRSRCRRLLVEHKHAKLGLIVIDYVSLMRPSANKNFASENETIAAISRELMSVKTEFECPILLLAQLNRECEKRPNKRPVLPDLRDSGALEQDANVVMFLYRDELYNEDSPDKGVAEVIIAKNRAGMQDTVRLAFQGSYQRFENLADHYQHQQGWN